ncbi:methyl-accepting chemotaxis protein [Ideonella livida]|uniref:Methyl-accepting transducer domain-containing protein n=1 Tax=Ideonella livida TaxID=2707176 RepID=A0A7C9TIQ1_9BURK|nr:methyl-accepting chemotaxis protein [Ideonella livida]NDY91461.1 hypothetical protein [Ideonella livida]
MTPASPSSSATSRRPDMAPYRSLAGLALCGTAVLLATWAGDWPGGAVALVLCLAIGLWRERHVRARQDMLQAMAAAQAQDVDAGPQGPAALVLARQVLPVWERQVQGASQFVERSGIELVERFAKISAQLDIALAASASAPDLAPGALDQLIDNHRSEVDRLLQASQRALQSRDEAATALTQVQHSVDSLTALAAELVAISRATQMLAMNASVEATRSTEGGHRFAVVAREVRQLATQSREAASRISRQIALIKEQTDLARATARTSTDTPADVAEHIEAEARTLVRALLGSLAETARSSRTLRQAGKDAQRHVEDVMMNLQFQDRLSQMLGVVTSDMGRMQAWLRGSRDEAALNPSDWLARLEASYPMEDMQAMHHGTGTVDKDTGVEFF